MAERWVLDEGKWIWQLHLVCYRASPPRSEAGLRVLGLIWIPVRQLTEYFFPPTTNFYSSVNQPNYVQVYAQLRLANIAWELWYMRHVARIHDSDAWATLLALKEPQPVWGGRHTWVGVWPHRRDEETLASNPYHFPFHHPLFLFLVLAKLFKRLLSTCCLQFLIFNSYLNLYHLGFCLSSLLRLVLPNHHISRSNSQLSSSFIQPLSSIEPSRSFS